MQLTICHHQMNLTRRCSTVLVRTDHRDEIPFNHVYCDLSIRRRMNAKCANVSKFLRKLNINMFCNPRIIVAFWVLLSSASACGCPCVFTVICPFVHPELVRGITCHLLKLQSPNMDQKCKITWPYTLRSNRISIQYFPRFDKNASWHC